jgi:hypothetical protein
LFSGSDCTFLHGFVVSRRNQQPSEKCQTESQAPGSPMPVHLMILRNKWKLLETDGNECEKDFARGCNPIQNQ